MIDINDIRTNPDLVIYRLEGRGLTGARDLIEQLVELDADRREFITEQQSLQSQRNLKSAQIGKLGAKTPEGVAMSLEVKEISARIKAIQAYLDDNDLREDLLGIPNLPDIDTPDGLDEADNVVADVWISDIGFNLYERDHVELGQAMGLMDFETAVKLSGTRFVVLKGALAKLERCLGQWMLDENVKAGYEEYNVPVLVNHKTMTGTGQLPKFEDDLYRVGDKYLIPTAEVSLTNIFQDTILPDGKPRRLTALTPCFRSEAGSAGRDTKGMIRQHQFNKVELVSVCGNEGLGTELPAMIDQVRYLLMKLELPHREVMLCKGDLGFSAAITHDFEVWMPSQHCYREISSVSYCGQFQARRMNARFKGLNNKGELSNEYLFTFNGSGLAVGRTLVAVMENYQQADGSILIPEVIRGAMGGRRITPEGEIV